jgi:endonuclease/exonuclease/phosphatase family metal-dependent hydrolase
MKVINFQVILQIVFVIPIISFFGSTSAVSAQPTSISVLTYNIRFANPEDKPNTWQQRKTNIYSVINADSPDVFGLQEALYEQVTDIEAAFPGFKRVGVGRDDGKESGEFSPLFINSTKFELISTATFWLSQTPGVAGSRGWDAACNRVVTWAELREKETNKVVFVFCTHFDHIGEIARRNSAALLLKAVDSISGNEPAIVMGDFNASPDSEPYKLITDPSNPLHLKDARVNCITISGPEITFTGFKVGGIQGERIDYIFLKGSITVNSFHVNPTNNGEYYPSDHLPVSAKLIIN